MDPTRVFYKVDSSRATFAELRRDAGGLSVPIVWISKLLRLRLPGSVNDPNVESLRPFEVPEAQIAADVWAKLEPGIRALDALGFEVVTFHEMIDLFNQSRTRIANLASPDGRSVARVWVRSEGSGNPPKTHAYCDFLTGFADGSFVWTTSAKAVLDAPPGCHVTAMAGAPAEALAAAHESAVQRHRTRAMPTPTLGRDAVLDLVERHHALVRDFHLARKLFRPMTNDERQGAMELETHVAAAATQGLAHPEVAAELARLQQKRVNWRNAATLLLVSLALFIVLGRAMWEWEFVLLLVGILFFHELGHYAAMKMFGYQNMRMFFIPLLGAAVSGTNYSAPGWKKVIVALMGPLPGIVVGAGLAIAGIAAENSMLLKASLIALLLNGINLLPVLPLDGGRVVQTLFFARHYLLDVVFRVVAGLTLIAISAATGDRFLIGLGVFMLILTPTAYKLGRVASELRKAGLRPALPNERAVPPDVADAIVTRIKATFPIAMSNKAAAQHALAVYETVNARTPGWLATAAFAVVHVGSVLFAGIMLVVVIIVQQGGMGTLGGFIREAAQQPQREVTPGEIVVIEGTPDARPTTRSSTRPTIVATFPKRAQAQQQFEALRPQLAGGAPVALFGQSILLPAPDREARARLLTELEKHTRDVFVDTGSFGSVMQIVCLAPNGDRAAEIASEIEENLRLPQELHLAPPWSPYAPADRRPDAPWRRARQTYLKLQSATSEVYEDPQMRELSRRMRDAARRGEEGQQGALAAEQMALFTRLRDARRDRIVRGEEPGVDVELARAYVEMMRRYEDAATAASKRAAATQTPATQTSATQPVDDDVEGEEFAMRYSLMMADFARAFGPRMGQLPIGPDGEPLDHADRFSVQSGSVTRAGLLVSIKWLTFVDVYSGAPAIVRWLDEQKCRTFKYEFVNRSAWGSPEDEESTDVDAR